jgi:hypothetical protein
MNIPRVVSWENNSPTAAQAGRKRRPKWLPVVWVYSWAPYPEGYIYAGMAFHVGGWTSRPIKCRRETLSVMKPKLWFW